MQNVVDHIGRSISLKSRPVRIVSLAAPQTELISYLGLTKHLIARTDSCIHPYWLASLVPSVGTNTKIYVDKIRILKPDLILCNKEINGFDLLPELEKIGPTFYSSITSINDSLRFIADIGILLDCRTESTNLIDKIKFKLRIFNSFMNSKPTRKVAYFIQANPWLVAGGDSFTNALLELNKFKNIYEEMSHFPKIDIERLRHDGDPEVLLLANSDFNFDDSHALKIGNYSNRSNIVFTEHTAFSWPGPRILNSLDYFLELHERLESHF